MPLLVHLEIIALDRFTIAVMTAKDLTRSSVVARPIFIMDCKVYVPYRGASVKY